MTKNNMLGIDLVYIPEFQNRIKNSSLEKIFLESELSENKSEESLAGVFAAKEAFFKALGRKENWLDVWIEKNREGKPQLKTTLIEDKDIQLSISHSGEYAVAIVMIND